MKLNISCDKEDCCLKLEYCASCAGDDNERKLPPGTLQVSDGVLFPCEECNRLTYHLCIANSHPDFGHFLKCKDCGITQLVKICTVD